MKKATIISLVIALVLAVAPVYAAETDIGPAIMETADSMIIISGRYTSSIGPAFCMNHRMSKMVEPAAILGPAIMETADGTIITSNAYVPAVVIGSAIAQNVHDTMIPNDGSVCYVNEDDSYVCCPPEPTELFGSAITGEPPVMDENGNPV